VYRWGVNPRSYQVTSVENTLDYANQHPNGRLLLVCPPGGGKTLITAIVLRIMATENKLRGLVIAHRREMVDHHYEHLLGCGIPPEMLGIIMGKDTRCNAAATIQVASVDTLNRRNKPPANILVSDEAHRDASKSRRKLRALYPEAFRLGVTATPHRLDGKGLRLDYDEMLVVSTISELIADGYLAAPRAFTVPPELLPNLKGVKTLAGEYVASHLDKAVNHRFLVGGIVEHWRRIAQGCRTVVFAVSIEHSKHIVAQFSASGVTAAHLDQDVSNTERKATLSRLESGDLQVVSCVNILAEGWDCPPCKCVVQARPTKSLNLHIQQTGRCMRPWKGIVPLILDHAGNIMEHGLPQMDRDWSLDDEVKRPGTGKAPCKVCPQCMAICPAGVHICLECSNPFPVAPRVLGETADKLEVYQLSPTDHAAEWERILRFSEKKGFALRWAKQVFEAKFGVQPQP
jgi:DNA repair protein RadD